MKSFDQAPGTAIGIEPEMVDVALGQGDGVPQVAPRRCRWPGAVVMGTVAGEPPRGDFGPCPELVGSGVPLHAVARVDDAMRAGRLPIAYAWMGLALRDLPAWEWNTPTETAQRVLWSDAIAMICGAAVDALESEGAVNSESAACITVPNCLDLDAQDGLRRALDARCHNATLLWRPVAAALSWLDRFGRDLSGIPASVSDGPLGRLLVVDLGLAAFEITVLDLVRSPDAGDDRIVVARRLPDLRVLHGEGVRIAGLLAAQAARATRRSGMPEWNLLWCTGFLAEVTDSDEARSSDGFDLLAARAWLSRLGVAVAARTGRYEDAARTIVSELMPAGKFRRPLLASSVSPLCRERVRRWLGEIRVSLGHGPSFLGTVAVGPLSRARCGHKRLGEVVASAVTPQSVAEGRVLTEGSGESMIAAGAARYELLRQAGRVPYLDSLPDIQTLLQRGGEPEWAPLLSAQDRDAPADAPRYVEGGKPWNGDVPGSFAVRAEEQELRLTVSQENERTVREVDFSFPRPVERETPVALRVGLTPGQGNPRVEAIPQDRQLFGGRRFYLDWRRCKDTGKSKKQAADEMERIFPPLEPRKASWECWRAVDAKIRQFVKNVTSPDFRASGYLDVLRGLLRQSDEDRAKKSPPDHATAIGSDGGVHATIGTRSSAMHLERFESLLVSWLADPKAQALHSEIYRTLGYCSSNNKHLAERLGVLIEFPRQIDPPHLIAIGNCLRDPTQVAAFAAAICERRGVTNDWLRALARILQYRADAAEFIDDGACYALLDIAHRSMREQLGKSQAKYIYRHASLCVAYLLRRRRYSGGFLDPQSKRAQAIKRTMQQAAKGLRVRQIDAIGGFVDLAAVTELIIDYIDRRGKGRIVLLTD